MTEFEKGEIRALSIVEVLHEKASRDNPNTDPETVIIADTNPNQLTIIVESTLARKRKAEKEARRVRYLYDDTRSTRRVRQDSEELIIAAGNAVDTDIKLKKQLEAAEIAAKIKTKRRHLSTIMRVSSTISASALFGLAAAEYTSINRADRPEKYVKQSSVYEGKGSGNVLIAGIGAGGIFGFLASGAYQDRYARRRARKIIARTNKTADQKA